LDQNLVLAGLGDNEEPAIALGRDGGQRGLGKPGPTGPAGACLEPKTSCAPEHFRDADVAGSEPVADLLRISRNALQSQQRHEGVEPRIGWSRAVCISAHWRSPGQGRVQACCGAVSDGCWLACGSAIGVAPWPLPAVTKVEAMTWLSRATRAAGD